ncbi:AN1-type zinc finger protein 2A [Drosophila sulfurigaster albostrigata]|uniref:AN1-type zinc finger protein 2A n=1 Tax=Drosophila sulfurigaster albostrigata TaxID=89887 RepID=UPI002D21A52E|nr:AN1-type zinc finger protein 2A [Drosophila sulfurigaster albostrigata]
MEFPHLGQHCNEATCNRLDFLPVKCDSCDKVFCASHYNYDRHNCPGAHKKNFQVPICPLCGEPVPTAPGVEPDLTVGQHIDKQCQSDSKKIYTNRCHAKGCKRKELIPVQCSQCKLNFCLRHRHSSDHDCKPPTQSNVSTAASSSSTSQGVFKIFSDTRAMAAQAAEKRLQSRNQQSANNAKARQVSTTTAAVAQRSQVQNIQGNMTEDEALAHALALSIMEQDGTAQSSQSAAAAAANAQRATTVGGRDKDKCSLS